MKACKTMAFVTRHRHLFAAWAVFVLLASIAVFCRDETTRVTAAFCLPPWIVWLGWEYCELPGSHAYAERRRQEQLIEKWTTPGPTRSADSTKDRPRAV